MLRFLRQMFAAPDAPSKRPLQIAAYTFGVCPGCRGLRAVTSSRCETCGSTRAVPEDS